MKVIKHFDGVLCRENDPAPGSLAARMIAAAESAKTPARFCLSCGRLGVEWIPLTPEAGALEEAGAFAGWLRAAIETKQRTAVAACGLVPLDDDLTEHGPGPGVWEVEDNGGPWLREAEGYYREWVANDRGTGPSEYVELDPAHAAHIAANDPRSVLARCTEDLALLEEHHHRELIVLDGMREPEHRYACAACGGRQSFPCRVLARIAHSYRYDHPGWRNEWKP